MLLKALSILLPWPLRRWMLQRLWGYQIHPSARIGLAWVFPKHLHMGAGSKIDHFTVAIHLDCIEMGAYASIGRSNWITGFPTATSSKHFQHQPDRQARLSMGESAAITKQHHLDCTHSIDIGAFSTLAGYHSQLLTHAIDVQHNRQDCQPISIGAYTFVGTNVVILGGAVLPAHSVLGAKSLLNKAYAQEWMLYAGVPARAVKAISREAQYFVRENGFVY